MVAGRLPSFWLGRLVGVGFALALSMAPLAARTGGAEKSPIRLVVQLGQPGAASYFSPDGLRVLTAEWGVARLWDAATGRELLRFKGHKGWIRCAAFSPAGGLVATGGGDGTVRIWDAATARETRRLRGHRGWVISLAFSPDGQRVLSGSHDGTARLWDVRTGRELTRFEGHSSYVTSVDFSPDGRTLLTGSLDGTVRMWTSDSGREDFRLPGDADYVSSVAFSPDGRRILTADADGAQLWDAATGRLIRAFAQDWASVSAIAFSPEGQRIAASGWGRTQVWHAETGREFRRFAHRHTGVRTVAFSPGGERLLIGYSDNTAQLWDVVSAQSLSRFESHASAVNSVAFSPSGRRLITTGDDGKVRIWEWSGDGAPRSFDHGAAIAAVAVSQDGRRVLTGGYDGAAKLWEMRTGRVLRSHEHGSDVVPSVIFSPDGRYVVSTAGATAHLWELETGSLLRRFVGHEEFITCASFSPDGQWLLTGSHDHTARLWEVVTGEELRRFEGHTHYVESVAFSPEGQRVLTGSHDTTARLWDVATGAELRRFEQHGDVVSSVAFAPDGKRVLTGSWDATAGLWDAETGRLLRRFEGHASPIRSVAFSPTGRRVLTGSTGGATRLWETETGAELAALVSFVDGSWAVVEPKGRFDLPDPERVRGLHWVREDDPTTESIESFIPLPIEIFMRDFFEPGLLKRVLKAEKLPPVPDISTLEIRRPQLEMDAFQGSGPAHSALGPVALRVRGTRPPGSCGMNETGGRFFERVALALGLGATKSANAAFDLRVFRDRRLVGWVDGRLGWPEATGTGRCEATDDGGWRCAFEGIRLPRDGSRDEVTFSAYAFNCDQVKSDTARTVYPLPPDRPRRRGRATVITMGVNAFESPAWNLRYAANDARDLRRAVSRALREANPDRFAEVASIALVSDPGRDPATEGEATRERLRAVLDVLAGRREVDPQLAVAIPGLERLEPARPEDLVLLAVSTHGYRSQDGRFHLFPSDIGGGWARGIPRDPARRKALLARAISNDDLWRWLRDVDAGELVLVIDACHSAASVEAEGFKPGPFGSRGLGQLAYEKGMRILAASQADELAREAGGRVEKGLLTYALLDEGLERGAADTDGEPGITLTEWLAYARDAVPGLAERALKGELGRGGWSLAGPADAGEDAPPAFQQPALFDFARDEEREVSIAAKPREQD